MPVPVTETLELAEVKVRMVPATCVSAAPVTLVTVAELSDAETPHPELLMVDIRFCSVSVELAAPRTRAWVLPVESVMLSVPLSVSLTCETVTVPTPPTPLV